MSNLHIQATDRKSGLTVRETQFIGTEAEAATYCRQMSDRFPLLAFKAVTRPALPVTSLAAAHEAMAAIEAALAA